MILGLTGGIATGKSTVVEIFREMGAVIIDADKIAKEVAELPSIIKRISDTFGEEYIQDGKLNREKIKRYIFPSKNRLGKLNFIMHPVITRKLKEQIKKHKDSKLVIVDVPLLFEIEFESNVDKVVLVYVDRDTQLKRLINRDRITSGLANRMIDSQMNIELKKEKSDFIIYNDSTIVELKKKVEKIGGQYE